MDLCIGASAKISDVTNLPLQCPDLKDVPNWLVIFSCSNRNKKWKTLEKYQDWIILETNQLGEKLSTRAEDDSSFSQSVFTITEKGPIRDLLLVESA